MPLAAPDTSAWLLLQLFAGDERLFHTGWFVESLATQVLVIFVIRVRGNPLRSRPSKALTWTSLSVVTLALLLPFAGFARPLGLAPLPAVFFAMLAALVACYLISVEWVKRLFYRHYAD